MAAVGLCCPTHGIQPLLLNKLCPLLTWTIYEQVKGKW